MHQFPKEIEPPAQDATPREPSDNEAPQPQNTEALLFAAGVSAYYEMGNEC